LYRLVLLDGEGGPLRGARYVHVSDRTPALGDRIELPLGTWVVAAVEATWSGDEGVQLFEVSDYGGTLMCEPETTATPG